MMLKRSLLLLVTLTMISSAHGWLRGLMDGIEPVGKKREVLKLGVDELADIHVPVGASHQETVKYTGASYIAVLFDQFHLPDGDSVVVHSPDSSISYEYTGKGKNDGDYFYASFIPGDTAIVEYTSKTPATARSSVDAFHISGYARGLRPKPVESVCGLDNSVPAKCLEKDKDFPQAYDKSKAVARLLINGTDGCTGWLAGSEGHLITNQHCISTPDLAKHVDIEFMAESASCSAECKTAQGCKGTVVATTSTFVALNEELDYAVVQLAVPASKYTPYGYLQVRPAGPVVGEPIYIPQHPKGWAKRIAAREDDNTVSIIRGVNLTLDCGDRQVAYLTDTQRGSSGSPVISGKDNLVVALHHCGTCDYDGSGTNEGVDVRDILNDLASKQIDIKNFTPAPPLSTTTPPPKNSAFCGKFHDKVGCQFWFWCKWEESNKSCVPRF